MYAPRSVASELHFFKLSSKLSQTPIFSQVLLWMPPFSDNFPNVRFLSVCLFWRWRMSWPPMIRHGVFLAYIRTTVTMQNVRLTPVRKPPESIPGILICAADLWHTTLWVQFCLVRNFETSKNKTKILYPKNLSLNLKGKCKCVYGCWHVYTCAYVCYYFNDISIDCQYTWQIIYFLHG